MNGSYAVLNLLPGMHATILSIIAAIITSWFFYSYPKFVEAKRNLNFLISNSKNLFTPEFTSGRELDITDPGGRLSFTKTYSALSHQNFIPNNRGNSEGELIENTNLYLCRMSSITATEPFHSWWNESIREADFNLSESVNSENLTLLKDAINVALGSYEFRGEDMKEIFKDASIAESKMNINPDIIGYDLFKERHEKTIEQLSALSDKKKLDEYLKISTQKLKEYQENIESYRLHQEQEGGIYVKAYDSISYRLFLIKRDLIPNLEKLQEEISYAKELINQKGLIRKTTYIIPINIIIGIISPMFFISIDSNKIDWNYAPTEWFVYILSLTTMFPYLIICANTLRAFKGTK